MPIYELSSEHCQFPPVAGAEDGLLAIGGDLSVQRLVEAYAHGIFPWYSDDEPIMWWSPDPRLILYPKAFKCSKSLRSSIRKSTYSFTLDTAFEEVILHCSKVPRAEQDGTWIVPEMIEAYISLHRVGLAHSVEVWEGEELVGGFYGVSLGQAFFGESMFSKKANTSKMALFWFSKQLISWGFRFIDCQVPTDHLKTLGAQEISRNDFMEELATSLQESTRQGKWSFELDFERNEL